MTIDEYSFGRIVVDGKVYTSDVIVHPDRVDSSWWREEGHRLIPEDLPDVILNPPDILVIGTGFFGRMEVPSETIAKFRVLGIKTYAARTKEATENFNKLKREHTRVVAALHLTC